MYMNLEKNMCRELEALEEKYRNGAEMSEGDIRRVDLLAHALKSMSTYKAMKQAEGYDEHGNSYAGNNSYMNNSYMNNNNSYMRGRGMDGRYVSRDMEQSGHYPINYQPMYPEERRW